MIERPGDLELFSALFEEIPDNIYFKDTQSRFIKINNTCARKFGLKNASEAVGRTDFDIFTSEHASQAFRDEQNIIQTGARILGVIEKETWKNGSVTYVSTTKIPLRNSSGEIVGLMGISRDVTEIKKMEEDLEVKKSNLEVLIEKRTSELTEINKKLVKEIIERGRAEQNYKDLVDNLELGIFIFQGGRLKYVNPAVGQILNCSIDDFNEKKLCASLLSPQDMRIMLEEKYDELKNRKSPFAYEVEFITPDKLKKWLRISSMPSVYEGNPAMQLSVLDMTERMIAENNLRLTEEKINLLIENNKDIILVYGKDSKVTEAFIPDSFEFRAEDFIGKYPGEYILDSYSDKIKSQIEEVFTAGRSIWVENKFQWNNKTYWFNDQIYPRRDNQGNVASVIKFSTDITEMKKYEYELRMAKEQAVAANKAKSEFLTNMSHELKTPLNGILGFAQLLKKEENLSDAMIEGLRIIEKSGTYLLNLINDVLDFSKIEARRLELYLTVFSLPELLNNIIEIVRFKSEEKNLKLELNLSHDIPKIVKADDKRISQVLLNLLSNGLKFTEKGSVKLTAVRKGGKVRFIVEDTGIGIPEGMKEDIFKPFRFIDNRARRLGGSGLGLTISRRLVELMGGELNVESQIGAGSKFWFEIEMNEVMEYIPNVAFTRDKIVGYRGPRRKILIIDDIQENIFLLSSILTGVGFDVIRALSGEEGIGLAINETPDLILMDLIMPEVDGFETTRMLRKEHRLANTKIIAVSASPLNSTKIKSKESGADDFIAKPINSDELFDKIGDSLNLEWQFKKRSDIQNTSAVKSEIMVPPPDLLRNLYKIARRGDLIELEFELKELLRKDKSYKAFVDEIKIHSDKFKVKQIRDIFERYLGEKL